MVHIHEITVPLDVLLYTELYSTCGIKKGPLVPPQNLG